MLQAWFSTSILLFASDLPSVSASSPGVQVTSEGISALPESSVQALMQLTQEFEELANTCLLVLHLEVSYWTMCVAACRYKNYVHATFFGRPLVGAGDKHSCVYSVCF
jgi:ribose/xylose/arabinose/galactoside ABC-type transport system permease subunit